MTWMTPQEIMLSEKKKIPKGYLYTVRFHSYNILQMPNFRNRELFLEIAAAKD